MPMNRIQTHYLPGYAGGMVGGIDHGVKEEPYPTFKITRIPNCLHRVQPRTSEHQEG
jgi:hypothetical protein